MMNENATDQIDRHIRSRTSVERAIELLHRHRWLVTIAPDYGPPTPGSEVLRRPGSLPRPFSRSALQVHVLFTVDFHTLTPCPGLQITDRRGSRSTWPHFPAFPTT